jgi:hypothetical protein
MRTAFDRIRAAQVVGPESGSTIEVSYQEQVVDGLAAADLEWQHLSNETTARVRALMWATSGGEATLLKAECVFRTNDVRGRRLCNAAVASFEPSAPTSERAALHPLPKGSTPTPQTATGRLELAHPILGDADEKPAVLFQNQGTGRGALLSSFGHWLLVIGAALLLSACCLAMRRRTRHSEGGLR